MPRGNAGRAALDHDFAWSLYFSDPFGNPYEITSYDYGALSESLK